MKKIPKGNYQQREGMEEEALGLKIYAGNPKGGFYEHSSHYTENNSCTWLSPLHNSYYDDENGKHLTFPFCADCCFSFVKLIGMILEKNSTPMKSIEPSYQVFHHSRLFHSNLLAIPI